MSVVRQLKVVNNDDKEIESLKKIRSIAIEQLGKAGIPGSVISDNDGKEIQEKIRGFITSTLNDYGLTIPAVNVDVKPNGVKINAVATTVGTTGIDIYHHEYLSHATQLGLKPEWLGCSFITLSDGEKDSAVLTLTGLEYIDSTPMLRFQRIWEGKRIITRTTSTPKKNQDIGIAIEKYKKAFEL